MDPDEVETPAWDIQEGWGGEETQDTDIHPDAFTPVEPSEDTIP